MGAHAGIIPMGVCAQSVMEAFSSLSRAASVSSTDLISINAHVHKKAVKEYRSQHTKITGFYHPMLRHIPVYRTKTSGTRDQLCRCL